MIESKLKHIINFKLFVNEEIEEETCDSIEVVDEMDSEIEMYFDEVITPILKQKCTITIDCSEWIIEAIKRWYDKDAYDFDDENCIGDMILKIFHDKDSESD